ncbi:MAG TPA: hypothetical protein DDZ24_03860 [Planctomycetaceae bacterium]|nr:hypothetical protein [Planctomycetaceae bacterium]
MSRVFQTKRSVSGCISTPSAEVFSARVQLLQWCVYAKKTRCWPKSHGHNLTYPVERIHETKIDFVSCAFLWGVRLSGANGHLHWTKDTAKVRVPRTKGKMNEFERISDDTLL